MFHSKYLIFFSLCLYWGGSLKAQDFGMSFLESKVNATIQIMDTLDSQIISCSSYVLEDTILYDSPQLLRLTTDQLYHLQLSFTVLGERKEINHQNFRKHNYALEVILEDSSAFTIQSVSAEKEGVLITGSSLAKNETSSFLKISIVNKKKEEIGGMVFGIFVSASGLFPSHTQYLHDINPTFLFPKDNKTIYAPKFESPVSYFRIGKNNSSQ